MPGQTPNPFGSPSTIKPARGRIWETQPDPSDGSPVQDKLFVAGVMVTAIVGLTVAFVWVIGDRETSIGPAAGLEVALGDFHFGTVSTSKPRTLAFEAVAVVKGEGAEAARREEIIRSREARIAQAVEEAGRAATDEELGEPDLLTFRSRIRGGVNKTLPGNVVEDVVLYDFRAF